MSMSSPEPGGSSTSSTTTTPPSAPRTARIWSLPPTRRTPRTSFLHIGTSFCRRLVLPDRASGAACEDGAMAPAGHRLHPAVLLEVTVTDRSTFGSPLTPRPDQSTREVFAPVLDHVAEHGPASLTVDGPRLLAEVVAGPDFAAIADVAADGSWTVHDDVLFPDPDLVTFTGLSITGPDGRVLEVGVPPEDWPTMHVLFAALAGPDGFTVDQLARTGGPASAEEHARAL